MKYHILEKKKLKRMFKLTLVTGGAAFEDSNIGPNLSPYMPKDKITLFCNEFNTKMDFFVDKIVVNVKLFLFIDNTFFFIVKGPHLANLLKIYFNILSLKQLTQNSSSLFISIFDFFDMFLIKVLFWRNYFNINLLFNTLFFKKWMISLYHSVKNLPLINE
jgi:ribosomal protein L11